MNQNYSIGFKANRNFITGLFQSKDFLRLKLLGRSCLLLLLFVFYQNESCGQNNPPWPSYGTSIFFSDNWTTYSNNYIQMWNVLNPIGTGPLTVEFWMKPRTNDLEQTILHCNPYSGNWIEETLIYYGASNSPNMLNFRIGGAWYYVNTTIPLHKWTHIALVWQNGVVTPYINGQSKGPYPASSPTAIAPGNTIIGNKQPNYGNPFGGELDDFVIHAGARTQSQIESDMYDPLYQGAQSGYLLSYMSFNQGIGQGNNQGNTSLFGYGSFGGGLLTNFALQANYTSNYIARSPVLSNMVATPGAITGSYGNILLSASLDNYGSGTNATNSNGYAGSIPVIERGFITSSINGVPLLFNGYGTGREIVTGSISSGTYSKNTLSPLGNFLRVRPYAILNDNTVGYGNEIYVPPMCGVFSSSNVSVSTTPTTASFYWSGSDSYVWRMVASGAGVNSKAIDSSYYASTSTTASIAGLLPNTSYDFYLKSASSGCTTWYPIACTTQSCTVPSGLSISNLLYGTATVNWSAINGITNFSYKVVDAGAGINGTTVASGTSTTNSVNVTGLTSGASYDVYVQSNCTQSVSSAWSNALTFITLTCTSIPSGLVVSNILYGGATITWTAINGANGFNYKVVNSGAGINGTTLVSGTSTTNSKVITGLQGGGTYDVYVQTICTPSISSGWTTTPASFTTLSCTAVPTNLLATNVSYSTCNATWASSVSNVQGYNWKVVDYGAGANAPAVSSGFSATTSATITGMNPNTFYDLYIQTACDNVNQSDWSNPLTVVTTACNAPTNLIAFSTGYTNVTINWATISNVQGYTWKVVLAGAGANGTAVQTGTSTGGPVVVNGLTSGTAYQVYVKTNCDNFATSVWSSPTNFSTTTCNVPTNISLSSVGFDVVTLNWTPVPNVLSYNYKVVEAGAGINGTAISSGTSTSPSVIATGLSASTSYDIYLQTNCAANVTSDWTIPITFTTLNCNPPINILASNLSFTGVSFKWTAIPNAAGYEWKVVAAGAGSNATAVSSGTTNADSVRVLGLTAGTDYDFYIKTNCSAAINSGYANAFSFTTQNCITPTSLAVANVAPGSATLTWSSVTFSAKYYWKVVPRGAGVNAPAVATDSSTTSSAVMKGLTGLTAYEAYVRINCGPTTTSPWSDPVYFSTPLMQNNLPWALGNTAWFNGVDDYVTLGIGLQNPNDFTIEFWARVESNQPDTTLSWYNTTDQYIPLIDRSSVLQTPYSIRYNPITGFVKVFRTDGTNTPAEIVGNTSINDGTYHHIAVTRNSQSFELKLYIDGILDGSEVDLTNVMINPTGAQTLMGARTIFSNNNKLHFKGNIDDVRFWNVVREISDLQNSKDAPLLGTEAGLIAYYDMENVISGNGQTVYSVVTPPLSATNGVSTGTSTTPIFSHPCVTFNPKELGIQTTPTTATLKFTENPLFFAGFDWKITAANAGANTFGLFSGTTSDTVTISGFEPGIQYDLYVKSPCTNLWQGPISLTTQNVWHNALHFDGTNDYVSTGNGSSFSNISGALTVEMWVRPEDNTGTHYLFNKETASSSGAIALYTQNGIPTFALKSGTWTTVGATDALPLNKWSHVAAVYNGTEMMLYVNGRMAASTPKTGTIPTISTNGFIGKKYNNTGYFMGMLDEFRIWSVARSTNQIQSNLYNFPATNSLGFVAYYPLNESNISAAQDITSNANNASLTGFALIGSTSNWVPHSPLLSDPVVGLMVDNNVTVYDSILNQGTSPILEKGFLWSVTNTTASSLVLGSSGTNRIVVNGTTFQADMTGLPLGASIAYRGYAYSADGIDYSAVMQNIPILCPAPYGIAASNVNTNSVQVNWTSLSGGTGYTVKAVYTGAGSGSTGIGTATFGNNMATITGLAALTSYDIYVSMNCTSINSDWTGPVTITTLCNPVNLPVSQNFSGIVGTLPSCWTTADVNQDEYRWGIDDNGAALLSANPVMGMNDWLFSGGLNLTTGTSYRVSFTYGALSTNNTEKLELRLGTTADPSAMSSTPLFTNNGFNAATLSYDLAFTVPTTGVYYLGWRGLSDGNTAGIIVDNVSIDVNPCGTAPTNLTVSNITATGASAFWNAVPSVSGYTWKVVPSSAGANATAVRTGTTTNLTVNMTGLLAGVNYDLFLKANCSANISSEWVGPYAFTTLTQTGLFASAANNDAYIDVSWSLPVDNCLLNAVSQPYPQGIHVELKDLNNNVIVYQEPIADLTPYIGQQQPTFTRVANGLNGTVYQIPNNTVGNYWTSNLNQWTIETWVKITPAINNAVIWTATNGSAYPVELKMNGQNLLINGYAFATPVPHSIWTHIAVSFTGTKAILYLNGVEKETKNLPYVNMGNAAYYYQFLKNFNNGIMGELRLWNRVRSATEIANNRFATSIPNANQVSTNLFLYLRWNTNGGGATNTGYFSTLPINFLSGTPPTAAYIPTPNYTPINGSFRHLVGANQNRTYQLNVRQIGSGLATVNCSTFTALGSTLPFQVPTLVAATDNSLDRVTLTWNNKSKLAERYKVTRAGFVRDIVVGTEAIDSLLTYNDIYNATDTNSIVNGTNYSYCVQAINNTLNQTYTQVCDNGKTFNLNLVATDNTYPDKVVLTWASVVSFNKEIKVMRDGLPLATLDATATSYTDNYTLFGKIHKYEISIIDSLGIGLMSDFDNGSTPAKGQIKGRVVTLEGGYALKNVKVVAHSLVDTSFRATVYTNFKGEFAFSGLYYGEKTGGFELTATLGNHKFGNNPRTITLDDSIFVVENVVFQDSTGLTVSTTPLAISNFTATPNATQDRVVMNWTYTPAANDSTIFEIYREVDLLAVLSNAPTTVSTYTDLKGIPQANYTYKVFAYKIQNGTVSKNELTVNAAFPAVTKPTNLTATANTTTGLVDLTWANTSTNIDGFNLYKNATKIAELSNTTLTYTDLNLIPGSVSVYTVKARRKPGNITFESAATSTNNVTAPALPNLSTLTATASTANNRVNLVWTVPTNLNTTYNFTGYRIYRKRSTSTVTEYIADVYKERPNTYEDRTGLPNSSYTYTVKTFKRMANGQIVESAGLAKTATFPVVSAPTALTASNNTVVGEVVMSWTPAYTNAARNIDGQVVYTGTDSITLPATTNTYRFMTNQTVATTFGVRTFRVIGGKRYFSNAITANAKPLASSVNPVLATNFKASQDLPNHIRLSWDYPNYVSSTFKIYRDNIVIATLGTTTRNYQDYTAVNGATHLYHIQAINSGNTSQKVGAWGRLKSISQLSGMVASATGKVGMPNVDITAMGTNFYVHTRTDSAGYYYIDGLPGLSGTNISVLAEGVNSTFAPATQTFATTSAKTYTLNFNNTFTPPALDTASPAKAIMINAVADYARRRIVLSWNQSSSNYDGVEVYRANTLLGTVNTGSNMVWYDTEGYPGISYVYSLRPFRKPTPTTKTYGSPTYKAATFPVIESVLYLAATPKTEDNKLTLTWSHRWDNHTYYAIERNSVLMTTIQAGRPLIWDDLTGEPGQQYTYTITAVMNVNGNLYTSAPVSINATYPVIGEVKNLIVSVPSNTLTGTCLSGYQRENNHVLVSWENSTPNVDGFRVYRDNNLLKELPKTVTAYQDYTGLPGSLHTYTVKAVLKRDTSTYNSSGVSLTRTFPTLAQPTALTTPANVSGAISFSWSYPEEVINGFYIYYNGTGGTTIPSDTIAIDNLGTGQFTYTHTTGIPNLNYKYSIRAYTKRQGAIYLSAPANFVCNDATSYPAITIPTNVQASDGLYQGIVVLTWDYPNDANATGLAIYRGNTLLGKVPFGLHLYMDTTATGTADYSVRAYRKIGNDEFYSVMSNTNSGYPLIIANSMTPSVAGMRRYGAVLSESKDVVLIGAPASNATSTGYIEVCRLNPTTRNWVYGTPFANITGTGSAFSIYNDNVVIGLPLMPGVANSLIWTGSITSNNTFSGTSKILIPYVLNAQQQGFNITGSVGGAVANNVNGAYFSDVRNRVANQGSPLATPFNNCGALNKITNQPLDTAIKQGAFTNQFVGKVMDGGGTGLLYTAMYEGTSYGTTKYPAEVGLINGTTTTYFAKPAGIDYNTFGRSLALSTQNDAIIGAPGFMSITFQGLFPTFTPHNGLAYIYNNGNTTPTSILSCPDISPTNPYPSPLFGSSVDIEGNFAIVGAPDLNGGKGAAYLYHKKNNLWNYLKKYEYGNTYPDSVGTAVRVGNFAVIGAPNANSGQGKVYWEDLRVGLFRNVKATNGTYAGKTKITWEFYANNVSVTGIKIYRDNILLGTAAADDTYWNDETGVVGKHYIYQVMATTTNTSTIRYADEGWSKNDGYIAGTVKAVIGQAPIENVKITATATIGSDKYTYTTLTDNSGNYNLVDVYYGDTTVSYTVTAEYGKHSFTANPVVIMLSPQTHSKTNVDFFDKTSYTISGFVHQQDVSTGLDSIRVRALHKMLDGTVIERETYTDKEGNYSLLVNPGELYLEKISVLVDNMRIVASGSSFDTTYHHFVAQSSAYFTNFTNFPSANTVDFLDITQYDVRLSVLTACNTPLTGGKYRIKVQGVDAGYEKTFTTSEFTGEVVASLPPLNFNINVESVENLNAQTQLVVNYLKFRPTALDLATLDKDTLHEVTSQTIIDNLTHRTMVYHKPPTISVLSGFDVYMCSNPNKPAIIQQGGKYSLDLQIQETFDGSACDVKSGYIIINNAGAEIPKDTVNFNDTTQRFNKYAFIAANPNLVYPHSHLLNIRYFSNSGNLLGEKNLSVLIEGSAQLPGSDIIVDLNENGRVPIPLFVVRDPVGDGSYATIETGSTTTKTLNFDAGGEFYVMKGSEFKAILGAVGPASQVEFRAGVSGETGISWEITATTTKSISTSYDPLHTGEKADVIMGVGLALQYGLTQQIKVSNCDSVRKTTVLGFSPHSIKTEWLYTVQQIEAIIIEYASKIVAVKAGTLKLQKPDGTFYSAAEAEQKLTAYRKNWQQILKYHKRETLPYYALCDKTGQQKAPEPYNTMANEWRNGFCPLVGSYDTKGNFEPKDNLIWDQVLVDKYNAANTAIRKLEKENLTILDALNWKYNNFFSIDQFVDEQYNLSHGVQAKNITFGGGTNYTETFESAESKSQATSASLFVEYEGWLGVAFDGDVSVGIGSENQIVNVEAIPIKKGGGFSAIISESHETAKANTNLISYTLSDGDPGDQFSVTVIQGPATNLGPYFSLLGGRSSCPYEAGTIARDNFTIKIYDPETGATTDNIEYLNVNPEDGQDFFLQITNNNPFGEARSCELFLDKTSNTGNAAITVFGDVLWNIPIQNISANQPQIIGVNFGKGIDNVYKDIHIGVRSLCGMSENTYPVGDSITLSVYFDNECSDIAIAEPDNNWVIQRRNIFDANSREQMFIKILDYDPDNEKLLSTRLEYRKLGAGEDWKNIPNSIINRDSLGTWNSENFVSTQVPYYPFFWDITDDFATYPDGNYEIRAVAECGTGGQVYSQYLHGKIVRQGQLFGTPEPADHIWTAGDEISVSFNRDLNCMGIADSNFVIRSKTQENTFLPGTIGCYNNKLLFMPALPLRYFDGDTLEMVISGVRTDNGYLMDTVRWDFVVIGKDIYVSPDSIKVELTQGEELNVSSILAHNTEGNNAVSYSFANLSQYSTWLSSDNAQGAIGKGDAVNVGFHINTQTMPLGTKTASLHLNNNGLMDSNAVVIQVTVLPAAPNWSVNPANFSENMTLLTNFNFDNNNVKSQDTMDLISIWVDNKIRGVANISKFTATNYAALIQVYGDAADANKSLSFRVWDASEGVEYDARPDNNGTISFVTNKLVGNVSSPAMLDIFTASDKARYIPLNQGWTMFSVNATKWNVPVNTALASLRHPHTNDVIKTANKSAAYVSASNSWVSANGLDSTNVHRGYQIYLQEADTLRITGAPASIKPIALNYGWNFVGYPLQTASPLATSFTFSTQPDSIILKTVAQNPNYSQNMVALYQGGSWKYAANSDMSQLRPDFAYKMRVNTQNTQMNYTGANSLQTPVSLLRLGQQNGTPDPESPESWFVNPAKFEHNSLISATVNIDKTESKNADTKVAAFVGDECRGVGELVYVKELDRYVMQMMVYSDVQDEEMEFHIFDADKKRRYTHYEPVSFKADSLMGTLSVPYSFRNTPPDASIAGDVYPNPFENRLKVRLNSDKAQSYTLRLTDLMGHILMEKQISDKTNTTQLTLDTANLDLVEGVYLLQVVGSLGETLTFKVVHAKQ